MRLVIKFGGTSIRNVSRIERAARFLKRVREAGNQVVCVVSAMGDDTNRLIALGSRFHRGGEFGQDYLGLLALGETRSTRLMAMALEHVGQKARALSPDSPDFPLVARRREGASGALSSTKENDTPEIIMDSDETRRRMAHAVEPLLGAGTIPVVSGFFVKDARSHFLSLGRGGSDITAFLLAEHGGFDEVIIVTDVPGVFTADPRFVHGAVVFEDISADELALLSKSGARVLHPNALKHKPADVAARIVSFKNLGHVRFGGTRITGVADTRIIVSPERMAMVTFSGQGLAARRGVLSELGSFLSAHGVSIRSLTSSDTYVTLYLTEADAERVGEGMHADLVVHKGLFTGLSRVKGIGEITLRNHLFIESPGIISAVSETLAGHGVNIVEMVTSHTDIVLYCRHDEVERSADLLSRRFGLKDHKEG